MTAPKEAGMLKLWGRKTSLNVQKAMWAIGELGLRTNASMSAAGSAGSTHRNMARSIRTA